MAKKAYEYAKENDMTVAEVKEKFNLKSHMSLIPEIIDDVIEAVEEIVEDNEELLKEAHALIGLLGTKTKSYLHFVNDNKEQLPKEYELVLPLIKRFIKE